MSHDGMFDGAAMTRPARRAQAKLGGPFKVLNVEIKHDSVKLRVQDPKAAGERRRVSVLGHISVA